jgi:hypothetical protein
VDGTLIPVHDKTKTAKAKDYRRSVNVQIVYRDRQRRVVAVGDAWPGNRNNIVVFLETVGKTLPDHLRCPDSRAPAHHVDHSHQLRRPPTRQVRSRKSITVRASATR